MGAKTARDGDQQETVLLLREDEEEGGRVKEAEESGGRKGWIMAVTEHFLLAVSCFFLSLLSLGALFCF